MTVQKIQLVPDEILNEQNLKERVMRGEITKDNYETLSEKEQNKVKDILFDIASENVNIYHGASSLEFILIGALRIIKREMNGLPLTETDLEIKESLDRILEMHELGNENSSKENWLMDYMGYAEAKSKKFLDNRKNYINSKRSIIESSK